MNDLLILALLLKGPRHGYAIKKGAAQIFGPRDIHNNLVYPLLRRFADQKWVTVNKAKGERGQTRQMYAITAAGREALISRLRMFSPIDAESNDQFHIRVGLFDLLTRDERLAILASRRACLESRAARLQAIHQHSDLSRFPAQIVGFLASSAQAELEWIEKLRRLADSEAGKSSDKSRNKSS